MGKETYLTLECLEKLYKYAVKDLSFETPKLVHTSHRVDEKIRAQSKAHVDRMEISVLQMRGRIDARATDTRTFERENTHFRPEIIARLVAFAEMGLAICQICQTLQRG
jgi:hypothetical protein